MMLAGTLADCVVGDTVLARWLDAGDGSVNKVRWNGLSHRTTDQQIVLTDQQIVLTRGQIDRRRNYIFLDGRHSVQLKGLSLPQWLNRNTAGACAVANDAGWNTRWLCSWGYCGGKMARRRRRFCEQSKMRQASLATFISFIDKLLVMKHLKEVVLYHVMGVACWYLVESTALLNHRFNKRTGGVCAVATDSG